MCGIAGFIGESKKPVLTYQLMTKLFEKSETRGIDAAGYWGTQSGEKGSVLYHKEPGKASQFVKKDVWKQVARYNPNLLLVHARGASKGVGEPHVNSNNHPFTSLNKSIGLIHNGRVDEDEYQTLKKKYGLLSQCDSEIILRIFENGESYTPDELEVFGDAECPARLAGISDVFSLINAGHMAVAVGERGENGKRMLWLFRNRHRPIWVVDMRDTLGQIFFISDPNIWEDAVAECSGVKNLTKNQKLIELPTEEIWYFSVGTDRPCPKNVQRFEVIKESSSPWSFDGKLAMPIQKDADFEVITQLDQNDRVLAARAPKVELPQPEPEVDETESLSMHEIDKRCDAIVDATDNIQTYCKQMIVEKSITQRELTVISEKILALQKELEAII